MIKPTKTKLYKTAHTSPSQLGMGDNYGTGIKQKLGRVRSGMGMQPLSPMKLGKPPRSLA